MTQLTLSIEETRVRELLKELLLELIETRRDVFQDILLEAVEDAGLIEAIREGEGTDRVDRDEIMAINYGYFGRAVLKVEFKSSFARDLRKIRDEDVRRKAQRLIWLNKPLASTLCQALKSCKPLGSSIGFALATTALVFR